MQYPTFEGWYKITGYPDDSLLYAHGTLAQADAFCASENSRDADRAVQADLVEDVKTIALLSTGVMGFDLDEEEL